MDLRTIQFDAEEPSDLSRAICDRPEAPETKAWKYIVPLLVLFLIVSTVYVVRPSQPQPEATQHSDYAPDVTTDIVEKDGVLYYPDGSPVRNYEQMERYLQSQ